MGSSVATNSNAVDNRLAVTDQAVGLNNYGGKTAYAAPIFDFSQHITASGKKNRAGGGGVNGVNIAILDNGAIDRSFDFAGYALSETLAYLIDGQKSQQAAIEYTADTVSNAVQAAANTQAAAAAASTAAAEEISGGTQDAIKKWGLIALGVGAVWWFWGRK